VTLTCGVVVVELRGFEPLASCMPWASCRFATSFEAPHCTGLPQLKRGTA
jgi:hypothetical protein